MMLTEQCELWRRRRREHLDVSGWHIGAGGGYSVPGRSHTRAGAGRFAAHGSGCQGGYGPTRRRGTWGDNPRTFIRLRGGSVGQFPEESGAHPRGREQGHGRFWERRQGVGGRQAAQSPSLRSDFVLCASMLRNWAAIPGSWRPGSWKTAGT